MENNEEDYYSKLNNNYENFLEKILKKDADDDAPFHRNKGCKFTEKVLDYLYFEWSIDVTKLSYGVQNFVMDIICYSRDISKDNINNTCGCIFKNLKN
jgi:hypothetical protein